MNERKKHYTEALIALVSIMNVFCNENEHKYSEYLKSLRAPNEILQLLMIRKKAYLKINPFIQDIQETDIQVSQRKIVYIMYMNAKWLLLSPYYVQKYL